MKKQHSKIFLMLAIACVIAFVCLLIYDYSYYSHTANTIEQPFYLIVTSRGIECLLPSTMFIIMAAMVKKKGKD